MEFMANEICQNRSDRAEDLAFRVDEVCEGVHAPPVTRPDPGRSDVYQQDRLPAMTGQFEETELWRALQMSEMRDFAHLQLRDCNSEGCARSWRKAG